MSSDRARHDRVAVIERAIAAYNAQDWDTYQEFFTEDLHFCHHNRGFEFHDRRRLIETLQMFARDLIPDRRLGEPTRLVQDGDVVVRQQAWTGTAIADVPGIAGKGDTYSLDICSVYVFTGDRVGEYHDFG